jgi:hypothetical protein
MTLRLLFIVSLTGLLVGQILPEKDTPATMTKLVVRLQANNVDPNSFAAKPKTMYRAGTAIAGWRNCQIPNSIFTG